MLRLLLVRLHRQHHRLPAAILTCRQRQHQPQHHRHRRLRNRWTAHTPRLHQIEPPGLGLRGTDGPTSGPPQTAAAAMTTGEKDHQGEPPNYNITDTATITMAALITTTAAGS